MLYRTDTSNDALASRYDEIPYDALPHPATHPARLATCATLAGHVAPPVEGCRVLEVGCNSGFNLIPMAVSLPGARFVGCDLSARALDEGRQTITTLGLDNITLVESDLAALAPEHGPFDFIVAHGVYSWVPPGVRDALFALAARRLTPGGILYVSFNTLPGCRVRQAAWDVLHHHVDAIADARARLDAARRLARLLADGGGADAQADQALRSEFRAIAEHSDSEICHDDLAVPNEPVLFDTFARHAARHGLRYLTEAQFHRGADAGISVEARSYLAGLDRLAREQYLDFVRLRRFRQSLLVRDGAPAHAGSASEWLRGMHVSATLELAQAADAGALHKVARRFDPAAGGGGPVRKLLDMLAARRPAACDIASLPAGVDLRGLSRPLEDVLLDTYEAGMVDLHVRPPAFTARPPERPAASPLARLQALARDHVTTLAHLQVRLSDANALKLLPLLDGTRDRAALTAAVRQFALDLDHALAADFVSYALDKFARLGLLMSDRSTP